jgi:import inner membrane translocase subunit TIM21
MLRHALITTARRSRALNGPALPRTLYTVAVRPRKELLTSSRYNNRISVPVRQFSEKQSKPNQDPNADGSDRTEIVLTPGQKVAAGSRLFMFGGLFLFAGTCGYFILKELIPTKMAPNSVFSRASGIILKSTQVRDRFGQPLKVYGRDHGGHREGRRNFIEHTDYTDPEDGSKRCRVRFNLEGKFGNAFVFCEVSDNLPKGEDFVYLMVQDKRNGHVITLVDNRSRLLTQRMAGGSAEGREVFANLLGGGKK